MNDEAGDADADARIEAWRDAGDPACWLDQVCSNCGQVVEALTADRCPTCGERR